jgi:hypothetical protein
MVDIWYPNHPFFGPDFQISETTGFLPLDSPIQRLPDEWDLWEEALNAARGGGQPNASLQLGGGDREILWRNGVDTVSHVLEIPPSPEIVVV